MPIPGLDQARRSLRRAFGRHPAHALIEHFLEPSGWVRSRRERRPVRADGTPLPWFTFGAIEFLERVVDDSFVVFEYGAGYSTLWWQRAASVHSVDHDPAWVAELRPQIGANVTLALVEEGAEAPECALPTLESFLRRKRRTEWAYAPDRVVRRGLEDERFLAYAARVMHDARRYDVIVIDGMARRLCAAFATQAVADDGIIVLDNANRNDYDAAFDIFEEAGFFQIPFWGLVPGADFLTCTSVFMRSPARLPSARFVANSLGLPEF